MNSERLTIIAVTYNSADVLPGFLAALSQLSSQTEHRLVVTDNDSTDATVAILAARAPEALVVRSPTNVGFAAGINLAISSASPPGHVLVINPDVRLGSGAIDAMISAAESTSAGIVVPQLRDDNDDLLFSLRRDPNPARVLAEAVLGGKRAGRVGLGEIIAAPRHYRNARSADWATGACMLLTAECLAQVGPWDESFFLYSEETEYAFRARGAGFTIRYEPTAVAAHRGGDVHSSPDLFTLLTLNRWRLYRRSHGKVSAALFRATLIVNAIPRALVGRATARAALAGLLSPHTDPMTGTISRPRQSPETALRR